MLQKAFLLGFVLAVVAGCGSCGKTGNHYLYAAIPGASQLAIFREDPYSGVLTQLSGSPYTVGNGARSVVAHPSGKYLYVANPGQSENDISLFNINSDGSVNEVTPRTPAGNLPSLLAMDPAGNYLYAANVASNNISVYSIDSASGELTQLPKVSPFNINISATSMQLSPTGNFLYVTGPSTGSGVIAAYSVSSGVLTFVGTTATEDDDPSGLAITPNGQYLYSGNASANSISIYCIAPCGTATTPGSLQQVAQSPLADQYKNPVALLLDPTGGYLYVANQGSNNVATYSITASTGFPVAVTDSPFGTETEPGFLALDPSGKYLYVGNQTGNSGIEAFGIASGSLNTIATYAVGNSVLSIAVVK
jgi:6-phosphogluconolactonase (cycloisomerase 2 family)